MSSARGPVRPLPLAGQRAAWPAVISSAALVLALIAFGYVATLCVIAAIAALYAVYAGLSDDALSHGGSLGFAIGLLAGCTMTGLMLGSPEVIALGILAFILALVVRTQLLRTMRPPVAGDTRRRRSEGTSAPR